LGGEIDFVRSGIVRSLEGKGEDERSVQDQERKGSESRHTKAPNLPKRRNDENGFIVVWMRWVMQPRRRL
jgi:hypothetical protein